jgi:hypothetical protein
MKQMSEQEQAAHGAVAEIIADLGVPFTLRAVADACERDARSDESRAQQLRQTAGLLRQLAEIGEE